MSDQPALQMACQVSGHLGAAALVVDVLGNLVHLNEGAERILGTTFADIGPIPASRWSRIFEPRRTDGAPYAAEELPLVRAFQERRPVQADFWVRGHDGVRRHINVAAIPVLGDGGLPVGAMALFWEVAPAAPAPATS